MKRRPGVLAGILFAVLIFFSIRLYWMAILSSLEDAFVSDYVDIFYDMKQRSMDGELSHEAATDGVISYYPVGTKLEEGSIKSKMVEKIRSEVIKDINRDK